MKGTILRLRADKGYGFIRDGGGTEHFFHSSSCAGCSFEELLEGEAVEFDEAPSEKGPRAGSVRRRPYGG